MSETDKCLKPNVVFEPLYDNWYACSHLVSPATAAMNIVDRHITIMEPYLSAPEIHAQAVRNPKMKGGPFMDFGGVRLQEVRVLLERTLVTQSTSIEFYKAVKALDRFLIADAKGFCLKEMYKRIPFMLRGMLNYIMIGIITPIFDSLSHFCISRIFSIGTLKASPYGSPITITGPFASNPFSESLLFGGNK